MRLVIGAIEMSLSLELAVDSTDDAATDTWLVPELNGLRETRPDEATGAETGEASARPAQLAAGPKVGGNAGGGSSTIQLALSTQSKGLENDGEEKLTEFRTGGDEAGGKVLAQVEPRG